MINSAGQKDYPTIIELWELSVRAFIPTRGLFAKNKKFTSVDPAYGEIVRSS